jgi:hypothetical protein
MYNILSKYWIGSSMADIYLNDIILVGVMDIRSSWNSFIIIYTNISIELYLAVVGAGPIVKYLHHL